MAQVGAGPYTGGISARERGSALDKDRRTEIALFRYGIIAPLLARDLERAERDVVRAEILAGLHLWPGEHERRPLGERTLRRWLGLYREGGFEALKPRARRDAYITRKVSPAVLDQAVALREAIPGRSVRQIIEILEGDGTLGLAPGQVKPSTLARHLRLRGKTRVALKATQQRPFRRYEKAARNSQWQSDAWYGPLLPDPTEPGKTRRTYCIAFLDDFSRLVTHAQFFFAEDLPSLLECFKQALLKRGIPDRVYCDNGAAYSSHQFDLICARLGIRHVSARPYMPEGKGKVERFWKTLGDSFLPELRALPVTTLAELNQFFWAWLEQGYHHRVHREIEDTPAHRFAHSPGELRWIDLETLNQAFLWTEERKVDKTACVSFLGNTYEVDARLVRQQVTLRYDPFNLREIQVWVKDTRYPDAIPREVRRERQEGVAPPSEPPAPSAGTGLNYLRILKDRQDETTRAALGRLSFRRLQERKGAGSDV